MSRRSTLQLIAILAAVATLSSGALFARTGGKPDRSEARKLYDSALDAKQRGELERSIWLLKDAWAADPSDLLPLIELRLSRHHLGFSEALRSSVLAVASVHGDSLFGTCAAAFLSDHGGQVHLPELERSTHPLTLQCAASLRALVYPDAASAKRLATEYPNSPRLVTDYAWRLARHDPMRSWELMRKLARSDAHPLVRLAGYTAGGMALHNLRQHDEAAAWEREGESRAREWGPGVLLTFAVDQTGHVRGIATELTDSVSAHAHQWMARNLANLLGLLSQVDAAARSDMLQELARRQGDIGRLAESLAWFESLVALTDSSGTRASQAEARARVGRTLVKLGRFKEAELQLLKARRIGTEVGAAMPLRETSHDLLHLYEGLGRYEDAVEAGHEFARISAEMRTQPTRMMAFHDLAWLHRRHGNLSAAEESFASMLSIIDSIQTELYYAGEYHEYAGDLERASEYYRKTIATAGERIRALAGLIRVSEAIGEPGDALNYARLADRDSGAWFPEYSPMLPGLLARQGLVGESREQYELARKSALERGQRQGWAQLTVELADLELGAGNAAAARALADSASSFAAHLGVVEIEVQARAIAAHSALELGDTPSDALASLTLAVRRGDAMRVPQLSSKLHTRRGDALLRAGHRNEALAAYARAADWVDSTAVRLELDPSRAGYRSGHVHISNRALGVVLNDAPTSDRNARYVAWSIRRKSGDPARAVRVPRGLPALIGRDQLVLDYVVLDTAVAVLAASRAGMAIHVLALPADTLRARVARFQAPIAPRMGASVDAARIGFDAEVAHQLYQDLLAPVLARHPDVRRLVIAADSPLHMLPFDALVSVRGATPRYVIDDFTIRYAPNIDALHTRSTPTRRQAVAVHGPERYTQVGTKAEIVAVSAALRGDISILDGQHATEAMLRSRATGSTILHFATHAEANDVNPDYARLALNASGSDDGWLHAFEIRSLPIEGTLVVLSACETAGGRLAAGEGTLSLSRAFLQAGASGTIATLWPVGAPTAELMGVFYERIAAGDAPDAALREARLRLRRWGFTHPFYWAPFVFTTRDL